MKANVIAAAFIILLFAACKGGTKSDQTTPRGVAEIIFSSAKSGEYAPLKDLCNSTLDTDGDSKKVCEVASDAEMQKTFKEYFSTGKVNGEPTIEGDKAAVKILFGPDGTKEETLNMEKKDGKWYLTSF